MYSLLSRMYPVVLTFPLNISGRSLTVGLHVGIRQTAPPPSHVLPVLALWYGLNKGEEHTAGSTEGIPALGGVCNLPNFLCLSDTIWHFYAHKDIY